MIQLRQSGLGWEEVSRRMPGRTADGCRFRYRCYFKEMRLLKCVGADRRQPETIQKMYVEKRV